MRHAAHVAHHSRGRLRIRVPSAKGKPAALETIRAGLKKMPGIQEVRVNETIGSLTIQYDPRHHADLERHLASEDCPQDVIAVESAPKVEDLSDLEGMIEHEAAFLAQHSHFAKTTVNWVDAMDRAVKRATNNAIDFKVVAPLALAVGAFLELGIEASTPVWLTMGLFSLNHLIELHTHVSGKLPAASDSDSHKPSHAR